MKTGGRPRHPDILTPRQWQVLELVQQGLTNEEIADRLGITLDGAKFHVSEILGKLGIADRYEAASWRPDVANQRRRAWVIAPIALLQKGKWNAVAAGGAAAITLGALAVVALLVWGVGRTSAPTPSSGASLAQGTPGTETTPLVFDVASQTLRPLPMDHLFYPLPIAGNALLVSDQPTKRWEIVRVDGTVVKVLPLAWPDVYPTPSADGDWLAYGEDKLLHMYQVSSGADRTIDAGEDVAGAEFVWSPDDRQIAVALSKTSWSPLLVGVVDVATGTFARRQYSPLGGSSNIPQGTDVSILGWLNDTQFEYRVVSTVETDPFSGISQGGALYIDSADTDQTISEVDPAGPWSWCPGGCAPLPPTGFENPDGLVSWCSMAMPTCRPVLGVVDCGAGSVRKLVDADTMAIAEGYKMSPDGKTLALTLRDKMNHQRLRLVDVTNGSSQDYPLPYVNEGNDLRWSQDGQKIILYFPGT